MRTKKIKSLIAKSIKNDNQTGALSQRILEALKLRGQQYDELSVFMAHTFFVEYIKSALTEMEHIESAATKAGTLRDVQPVLDAAEKYFLASDDVIPDHLGLIGLLDDAYLTHRLMEEIADRYNLAENANAKAAREAVYGDLASYIEEQRKSNGLVRNYIGEEVASVLDHLISATLAGPSMQENFNQILVALAEIKLPVNSDIK